MVEMLQSLWERQCTGDPPLGQMHAQLKPNSASGVGEVEEVNKIQRTNAIAGRATAHKEMPHQLVFKSRLLRSEKPQGQKKLYVYVYAFAYVEVLGWQGRAGRQCMHTSGIRAERR